MATRRAALVLCTGLALTILGVPTMSSDAEPLSSAHRTTALPGTVTASSSDGPKHHPAKATDGDLDSHWRAADADGPHWLAVDLGDAYVLRHVRQVFAEQDVWSFRIEGSLDGSRWVGLVDRSRGASGAVFGASVNGTFRYVRMTVIGSKHRSPASSAEFTVTGTADGTNIAVGKTATASTSLPGFAPKSAIDGKTSTSWVADSGSLPQWLTVDLGAPSLVTRVVQNFEDSGTHAYVLEGSIDGETWTVLADHGAGVKGRSFDTPVDDLHRFVRLTITGSSNDHWASSVELEVIGFEDLARGRPVTTSPNGVRATVDLGGLVDLHRVHPTFDGDDPRAYRVEGSVDGVRWRTLRGTGDREVDGIHRYVRVSLPGEVGRGTQLTGLTVYGTAVTRDLAVGTSATSTSLAPGHEPYNAVDGSSTTSWRAESDELPQTLTVDLGNASVVSRVEQTFPSEGTWAFRVEASPDEKTWTPLLDRSDGAAGRRFGAVVDGTYRYVRLTVLGTPKGAVAGSDALRVLGIGSPVTTRWWEDRSGVMRYYPQWQQITLDSITAELDTLQEQGFHAIELATVVDGHRDLWAGLATLNLYRIAPSIGTMDDFRELIEEAHARDLEVIFFANPGYAHVTSEMFRKAEDDFRNGVESKERSWFDIRPEPGEYPELWHYSERAGGYYWGTWDKDAPSFNFSSRAWLDETRKYIRFWMDTGVDGIVLDAPNVYHTTTQEKNNYAITDVLRNYDTFMNAEGVRETTYITDWHYNSLQDYTITQWANPPAPGSSAILDAIESGNPAALEDTLKNYRDLMNQAGGITQTPPNWGRRDYPSQKRLLEIATLTTMGTLFYLVNDHYTILPHEQELPWWPEEHRDMLYRLIRAQGGHEALSPSGLRSRLRTNDDTKYYAFERRDRSGSSKAIVVLNYQGSAQDITVDLTRTGISTEQTPVDLLTGRAGPKIRSATYEISLPAYGFAILAVE